MLFRLFRKVFYRGFQSPRHILDLGDLEKLAQGSPASWLLAQEKSRLEYLAAKEAFHNQPVSKSFDEMLEKLLQLQSTNALVQSLLNEHQIEQMLAEEPANAASEFHVGKSR
jgi:hypothetical protein